MKSKENLNKMLATKYNKLEKITVFQIDLSN